MARARLERLKSPVDAEISTLSRSNVAGSRRTVVNWMSESLHDDAFNDDCRREKEGKGGGLPLASNHVEPVRVPDNLFEDLAERHTVCSPPCRCERQQGYSCSTARV